MPCVTVLNCLLAFLFLFQSQPSVLDVTGLGFSLQSRRDYEGIVYGWFRAIRNRLIEFLFSARVLLSFFLFCFFFPLFLLKVSLCRVREHHWAKRLF